MDDGITTLGTLISERCIEVSERIGASASAMYRQHRQIGHIDDIEWIQTIERIYDDIEWKVPHRCQCQLIHPSYREGCETSSCFCFIKDIQTSHWRFGSSIAIKRGGASARASAHLRHHNHSHRCPTGI